MYKRQITRDLEEKYNLHKADRKQRQADNPLRKVDVSQGNMKKQVANTVKSLCATYRFQSLGEYRALLSLYNISLEEVRGEVEMCIRDRLHAVIAIGILEVVDDRDWLIMAFLPLYFVGVNDNLGMEDRCV